MGTSSEIINIAASAQRIEVDNRISLRFYYRIANNILKQADIFRSEKNIIDLYVMLLRFSSLALETIPSHRDYKAATRSNKEYLKNKSLDVLIELEKLKPAVQQRINQLTAKHTPQARIQGHPHVNGSSELSTIRKPAFSSYNVPKAVKPAGYEFGYSNSRNQKLLPLEERFQRLSVNFVRPRDETLSRHSILGPNGLHGHWQPPKNDIKIQYPSNIDLTPVEIPSFSQQIENELAVQKDHRDSALEVLVVEPSVTVDAENCKIQADEPMISFEEFESLVDSSITRQPSPPPVLTEVQGLIPAVSPQIAEAERGVETACLDGLLQNSQSDGLLQSEAPLQLHISTTMMNTFMKLAKSNTVKNLETCGVLAGSLKDRKFYVTALIIPKQESTSDSCQTTNEEEIFEVQDKRSLFPLGWIHTHPTQSCFMSSIDVHTHYSYQIMLPESVAIVMAPKDSSRQHGIFRLTTPGGMSVIRHCQRRGFHPHDPPPDGGPIYKTCTDVYMNPSLNFDVLDLR